jgi:hypothetical protein
MLNGYSLNLAIGLQVVLGALVTGLSAAIKPTKVSQISVSFKLPLSATPFLTLLSARFLGGHHDCHPR